MADRAPLAGWREASFIGEDFAVLEAHPLMLSAWDNGIWRAKAPIYAGRNDAPSRIAGQLAAEDAARALVAEMATALGGSVIWGVDQPQPLPPHLYMGDNDGNT